MITLKEAVSNHINVQFGTYISGREANGGFVFHYSEHTPDIVWNRCPVVEAKHDLPFDWMVNCAKEHGVQAGLAFGGDGKSNARLLPSGIGEAIPERWMSLELSALPEMGGGADQKFALHMSGEISNDFLKVFGSLFSDESTNQFFKTHYNQALRNSIVPTNVKALHIVVYDAGVPVAVASTYVLGKFSGLYNVGVVSDRQKTGLGTMVSLAALKKAEELGAEISVLQCECGTHVERTYQRLGFRDLEVFDVYQLT